LPYSPSARTDLMNRTIRTRWLALAPIIYVCCAFVVPACVAQAASSQPSSPQAPSAKPVPPIVHGGLPVVSPDGSRIAFSSNRDGNDDVFVISSDGSHETQLTRA